MKNIVNDEKGTLKIRTQNVHCHYFYLKYWVSTLVCVTGNKIKNRNTKGTKCFNILELHGEDHKDNIRSIDSGKMAGVWSIHKYLFHTLAGIIRKAIWKRTYKGEGTGNPYSYKNVSWK